MPLNGVWMVSDLPVGLDIVLHATKANDCVTVSRELRPCLYSASIVVSLQNGISEDALAGILGRERVAGCVVGWGAANRAPGRIEITPAGELILGNIDHKPDGRLTVVRDMLAAVQPTRLTTNIMGELYAKLIINACINSLGAVTGATLGKLLAVRKIRNVFIAPMREAMAVADAMGIAVAPGAGGKLDYDAFLDGDGWPMRFKRHLFIRLIGFKYRRIRSSSLQSLERGRPTEIDYLDGYICDRAAEHGIAVPVNRAVVAMTKAIEAGRRSPSMANMVDPVFAGF